MANQQSPALIIIDVQMAIDDPVWGRRGQPDMESAIAGLLAAWRSRGWPIAHVRHDSTELASPYRPDGPGNEFKPEAAPLDGEFVFAKTVNSAFIGGGLERWLANVGSTNLVIAGVLLENSVDASVRMAANLGYSVKLPADAVASIDRVDRDGERWTAEKVHALWLSVLDREYADVTSSDALIASL